MTPRVVAVLAVLLCLTGCATRTDAQRQRDRIEAAPMRTDLDPIVRRWPQLGAIREAHWVGGSLADERTPGLSALFLEVVAVLAPNDAALLAGRYPLTARAAPDAPRSLRPHLPVGDWVGGPEIDAAMQLNDEAGTGVWMQPQSGVVYLRVRGESLEP